MSRSRTEKLFRGKKPSLGVSAPSPNPLPLPLAREDSSSGQQVDPDLTRALKQIFEVRNCKLNPSTNNNTNANSSNTSSSNNSSDEASLTLFGRKLSPPASTTSSQDGNEPRSYSRQGTDKLPPAATAHLLKELHKQRLKQRGITPTATDFPEMGEIEFVHTERRPEVSTLPLLNRLQEKRVLADDVPEPKRQRIEKDQAVDLSLSMVFGSPNGGLSALEAENSDTSKDMEIENNNTRSGTPVKNPEQLTLFYNGQVLVYDDVPSDKAKAIMVLASSISTKTSCFTPSIVVPTGAPAIAKATSLPSPKSSIIPLAKKASADKEKRSSADVPQARKASIQRFLEKRKDRLFPKPLVQSESEKGDGKDRSRSRSPSPGLLKDLHCDEKRCAASEAVAPTTATVTGATTTVTARQWIGV